MIPASTTLHCIGSILSQGFPLLPSLQYQVKGMPFKAKERTHDRNSPIEEFIASRNGRKDVLLAKRIDNLQRVRDFLVEQAADHQFGHEAETVYFFDLYYFRQWNGERSRIFRHQVLLRKSQERSVFFSRINVEMALVAM